MKYLHEKILPAPDQSFVTHDEIGRVIDCTFHVHPEYELIRIASSFGTRFIGDDVSMFEVGDLALVGPMVPHHYYNSPADSQSAVWGHARVVQFRDDFAGATLFGIPEMAPVKRMLEASRYGIDFPAEIADRARPLINSLFEASGPSRVVLLLEVLSLLAGAAYRTLSTISGETAGSYDRDHRMNGILAYMHNALAKGRRPTLDEVAAKANMNPQAFSRYFRKTTFKRFIDYVNEVRVGKACRMLIDTDKTVAQICFQSGFSNLSNFNRQFHKVKTLTPKEFRQQFNPHS
jgi:AraC-like DNA-binding protein